MMRSSPVTINGMNSTYWPSNQANSDTCLFQSSNLVYFEISASCLYQTKKIFLHRKHRKLLSSCLKNGRKY